MTSMADGVCSPGAASSSNQESGDREGSQHGLGLFEGGVVRGIFDDVQGPFVTETGSLSHGQPGLAVMTPPDKGRWGRDLRKLILRDGAPPELRHHASKRRLLVGRVGAFEGACHEWLPERPELVLQSL